MGFCVAEGEHLTILYELSSFLPLIFMVTFDLASDLREAWLSVRVLWVEAAVLSFCEPVRSRCPQCSVHSIIVFS